MTLLERLQQLESYLQTLATFAPDNPASNTKSALVSDLIAVLQAERGRRAIGGGFGVEVEWQDQTWRVHGDYVPTQIGGIETEHIPSYYDIERICLLIDGEPFEVLGLSEHLFSALVQAREKDLEY